MEYLVASLVVLLTVAYAVTIAVNVEKGKSWALEIARAISMLDPQSTSFELRSRGMEVPTDDPDPEVVPEPVPDRLAA